MTDHLGAAQNLFSDDEIPPFADYLAARLGHPSQSQDKWLLAVQEYLDELGRRVNTMGSCKPR